MHAYLLLGTKDIDAFPDKGPQTVLEFEVTTIAQVRDLNKDLKFPPQTPTIIHLTGIEYAKHEAQNSLLKILEEPPSANITFVLTASSDATIIPTILSRVSIIRTTLQTEASDALKPELTFTSISKITDRELAREFVQNILKTNHTQRVQEAAICALEALNKNGAVQLHLTNLLLNSLPSSSIQATMESTN